MRAAARSSAVRTFRSGSGLTPVPPVRSRSLAPADRSAGTRSSPARSARRRWRPARHVGRGSPRASSRRCPPTSTTKTAAHRVDERSMPPCELPQLIAGARRPGRDRLVVQVAADVGGQRRRRSVSPRLVLLERLGGDRLEVAAVSAADRAETRGVLLLNRADRLVHAWAERVRQTPGQQLVQNDAERIHVAARVELQRVGERPAPGSCRPACRSVVRRPSVCVRWTSPSVRRATPKSRIFGLTGLVDEDVGRLQIAVDQALVGARDRPRRRCAP